MSHVSGLILWYNNVKIQYYLAIIYKPQWPEQLCPCIGCIPGPVVSTWALLEMEQDRGPVPSVSRQVLCAMGTASVRWTNGKLLEDLGLAVMNILEDLQHRRVSEDWEAQNSASVVPGSHREGPGIPLPVPCVPLENFNTYRHWWFLGKVISLKVVVHLAGRLGLCQAELRCFWESIICDFPWLQVITFDINSEFPWQSWPPVCPQAGGRQDWGCLCSQSPPAWPRPDSQLGIAELECSAQC